MKKRLKNFEKFKTVEERVKAFYVFCRQKCDERRCDNKCTRCQFEWLSIEFEEEDGKPLPCPFCGSKCEWDGKVFKCTDCQYRSSGALRKESAIAAHNRVAKTVMEAKKGEME